MNTLVAQKTRLLEEPEKVACNDFSQRNFMLVAWSFPAIRTAHQKLENFMQGLGLIAKKDAASVVCVIVTGLMHGRRSYRQRRNLTGAKP